MSWKWIETAELDQRSMYARRIAYSLIALVRLLTRVGSIKNSMPEDREILDCIYRYVDVQLKELSKREEG